MDLVLDIGNFRLKGALFETDRLVDAFACELKEENLKFPLAESVLISSVNPQFEPTVCKALGDIPYEILDFSKLNVMLDVEKPEEVGHDRIANVYGALYHFPQNDCIVVDLGTTVTFDYVSCAGGFLGGAIYPGMHIAAKALAKHTSKLPEAKVAKPPKAVAKSTETNIQSGLYFGLLGAVERVTFEMRTSSENPSNVKVIATGGLLHQLDGFEEDLNDLVDLIDPHLTLVGIHEIMKENKKND